MSQPELQLLEKIVAEKVMLHASQSSTASLKHGGSDGTYENMDQKDIHGRLARMEGGWATMQWAVGLVSAVLIGGMAILWNDVSRLEDKVDALPGAIKTELQDLNSSMIQAIQAARDDRAPAPPQIIYLPAPAQPVVPSP